MGDEVEIVTQMSGGMAGPDPKMRSKRIAAKGMRQVRPAPRMHAGFLPGMGEDLEGDEIEVGLFGPVRKPRGGRKLARQARPKQYLVQANPIRAGFLPGMGDDPCDMGDDLEGFGAEVAAGKRQKVIPVFRPSPDVLARGKALFAPRFDQVAGLDGPDDNVPPLLRRPPEQKEEKPSNWGANISAALSPLVAATGEVTKGAAAMAEARRSGGPQSVTHVTNVTPATDRSGSKLPWIATGVGALVAVGILAFVLTRKKA